MGLVKPFAFMGSSAAGELVNDGLVLYLDAGDTASYPGTGTTWTDLSSTGQNYTLNGSPTPTHVSGDQGYFTMDGSSQYFENPVSNAYITPASSSVEWTIETIAESNTLSGYRGLATVWHSGTNQVWWHGLSGATSGGVHWALRSDPAQGGSSQFYNSSAIYSLNTLTHMIWKVNYTAQTLNCWLNGTQVITDDALTIDSMDTAGSDSYLQIGKQNSGNYWSGKIAMVRIYNEYGFTTENAEQNYDYWKNTRGYAI